MDTVICNKQNLMPKLRKNRRIETRWGVKYYTAVRNAVFLMKAPPYVPAEPPPSLKEHVSEYDTLYMCAQCKDCFRFRSSLEDHLARKSWILGYWCQQCFMTVCTHSSTKGSLCSACLQVDRGKRSYLRSRGLHKSQKFGAVRIFYNQCEFFAHLRVHSVTYVHMGDLMLMPLPTNMNHSRNSEIDVTCEAFMEHTFMMKVHIIDWLKDKKIDSNWWQLTTNETKDSSNRVMHILKGYKGRYYFKPLDIPLEEQFSTLNSSQFVSGSHNIHSNIQILESLENPDTKKSSSSVDTATSISDETVIENEDNPCTVNDIAFVDCGPTSKHFESEIPVNNSARKHTAVSMSSTQDSSTILGSAGLAIKKSKNVNAMHLNSISSDVIMSYGNTMITPKFDTQDSVKSSIDKRPWKSVMHNSNKSSTPIKLVTKSNITKVDKKMSKTIPKNLLCLDASSQSDTSSGATKMDVCKSKLDKLKQNIHMLTVNSGQKIVTFQSSKQIDINTIIKQLPPHIINSKKIVFIGQDSNTITVHSKQELSSTKVVQLVPETSLENGMKSLQTKAVPFNTSNELSNKDSDKDIPKNQIEPVKKKLSLLSNKVVYQNGRKYIIKQSTASTKNSKVASNVTILTKEIQEFVQSKFVNGIPPLIPLNSIELENLPIQERVNSLHSDVSPLTPSPSPSELSSSSSCDVQSKQSLLTVKGMQNSDVPYSNIESIDVKMNTHSGNDSFENLSFHKGDDENLYLDVTFHNQKPIYTIVDTSTMITKCKHEMLNEFFHLSRPELTKRYEHLEQINDEILNVMSFVADNVIKENLKAVNILQHVLKHCIDKCSRTVDEATWSDPPLDDWESELARIDEKPVCKSCNRVTKPKFYIPGFSKPARNDVYCSCYRHVCQKCHTYQGNSTRFVAHQTFHDKEKPYLCPDCYRKFTAFKALEIHTWTSCFHTLKKRILGCKICEIDGFQDMESIARHFVIMHSHNKIACEKCYIVLPSYTDYKKHRKEKHPDANDEHPVRLVLCKLGRCIVRSEEYMLHMEKHLVVQRLIWFKCPFCMFVNAEVRCIWSHLQNEHASRLKEIMSSEVLRNVLSTENNPGNNDPLQNKFTNAHENPCEDGIIVPKIINTRTITSEVFERGAQDVDDYLTNLDESPKTVPKILDVRSIADLSPSDSKICKKIAMKFSNKPVAKVTTERSAKQTKATNEFLVLQGNATTNEDDLPGSESSIDAIKADMDKLTVESIQQEDAIQLEECISDTEGDKEFDLENLRCAMISKPPPLARIPQHIIELNRSKKTDQPTKKSKQKSRSRHHLPHRLALNGPINSQETILDIACHLCGEPINTSWPVLSSHFQERHSQDCKLSIVTSRLLRMSPEFINGGYKDLLGNRKRKTENGSSNAKRRRRWTPKKYSDGKSANFAGLGLCVTQETAEDSEGKFRCKKCDQRCSDMADLREHIATDHRIKGRYLICLECGDNFVVAPSLQMHLKAFHGIEDPITYMAKNTSYAPESIDDTELAGKAIETNQCHVCMAVFEDKAAVDKHLRVHGMAFLNRKRIEAQNALKSPEKKTETDEEKSPVKTGQKEEPVRKDSNPVETILEKITATI
ncbi:uncharacterized protein LOC143150592 isoform X2 [Ptiloglossa arizonensis]|uniref:uncharacterized protein LOC143150592 isoform X2 n=1 Tax=Ptiloglossa arizonensis TaxID=3350558 RepID=UPI003F9FCBF3